jgi:DNA-binding winged helix-turn-helix (wHTH) protein
MSNDWKQGLALVQRELDANDDEQKRRLAFFGPFSFLMPTMELARLGKHKKLEAQPAGVLAHLLERPGQLIAYAELESRLWPHESSGDFRRRLFNVVRKLRRALRESVKHPRYFACESGKGYRLICAVEVLTDCFPASRPFIEEAQTSDGQTASGETR